MTNTRNPNFDRVASIYDFFKTALFFGAIQRCQYYHLPLLKDCKRILVIGGGTGKIIGQISHHCEFDELVFVDSSVRMIEKAKTYIRNTAPSLQDKISFQNMDILTEFEESKFDAVIAPFIFDCFTNDELNKLGARILNWLEPNGLLLFSDFHESKVSISSRMSSRLINRSIYWVLDLTCNLNLNKLPDFELMFENLALIKTEKRLSFAGILQSLVMKKPVDIDRLS